MISDKQKMFRKTYRSNLVGWYSGYVHLLIIYGIGFSLIFYFSSHLQQIQWWEWVTIPIVFLLCNIFEWYLHRYVMHRPVNLPGLKAIYERHTMNHHQFFTDSEMRFLNHRDWRVTVFPTYALVVFTLISIPPSLIVGYFLTSNVGWLFISTTIGMYLVYEFMHFCCHVNENVFVANCPFVNTLRRHHTAHHNQSMMMNKNMNLTFPITDWFLKTSDLDCGLLRHLFNGYSTKFVRDDLPTTPRTPPEASSRPYII
ncbi:MAG: fatty acid hydroxylase [Acidiferrobacteraceae bacterium]|nr:fatty acid hydroxylase [Acidiferrobacteraceae bacterium]|tara:strand:- start:58994 stop:59761 length:768 start_codon:yes stop_codon:yes gene_type:complete